MRIIKLFIISFLFLFGVLTAISLLIPSHIRLSKIITIQADPDSVFSLIKNKNQWHRWHPAFVKDTSNLKNINTKLLTESDSVLRMQWQQPGKKAITTEWEIHNLPGNGANILQWHMYFDLAWYPWQKLGSLFYEANYGRMMEQGLLNIKTQLEAGPRKY